MIDKLLITMIILQSACLAVLLVLAGRLFNV